MAGMKAMAQLQRGRGRILLLHGNLRLKGNLTRVNNYLGNEEFHLPSFILANSHLVMLIHTAELDP